MKLLIKDIIEGDTAVSTDDGDRVYQKLDAAFRNNTPVELDFSDINIMTTAFLNAAISQLYSSFTGDQLNKLLKLVNVEDDDKILFKKVVDRAKEYFANKKDFENSANDAFYGQ